MAQASDRHFCKEDIQMTKKYIEVLNNTDHQERAHRNHNEIPSHLLEWPLSNDKTEQNTRDKHW